MEPENRSDRPNLPAVPPAGPPTHPEGRSPGPESGSTPVPPSDPWASGRRRSPGEPGGTPPWLRRLRPRSVRLAVGLGLLGAAVLLFPFAAAQAEGGNYRWWLPIGLGIGTLALITLFRLDRVMFGWAPHVAGVVLVATLVWQTSANPWSWGLALGVGTVVAGLLLLPRWRVLAAGAVLLVVFGVGYQFRSTELADQRAQIDAQAGNEMRNNLGVDSPQIALYSLDSGVASNNPRRVCRLLQDGALAQLQQSTSTTSCEQAVAVLHARAAATSVKVTEPGRNPDPTVAPGQSITVNGCETVWGSGGGSALGRIVVTRTDAATPTYQVSGFQPC